MKIKKIIWASYGNQISSEAVNDIALIAKKYNSEVVAVYIRPTTYFQGIEYLPAEEKGMFSDWVNKCCEDNIKQIETLAEVFRKNGQSFRLELKDGIPHEEIIQASMEENADIIAVGKGKTAENNYSISRTTLKLIRMSKIPVLAAERESEDMKLDNILVPTGLYDIHSRDFMFALDLSADFNSKVCHLNVLTTGNLNLPAEVINRVRGDTYNKIASLDVKLKNVEPIVVESTDPATGIMEFTKEHDVDLIVMLVHSGKKKREQDFMGSVAQRVVTESTVPVLLIRP